MTAAATGDISLREMVRGILREGLLREELAELGTAEPPEILTCAQAAARAQVCTVTVRRWIRDGRLPEHRAGRQIRVRRTELDEMLRRERQGEP